MIYTDCKNSIQFNSCLCLQYIKNAFHFPSNFTGSYFSASLFLSFGFFFEHVFQFTAHTHTHTHTHCFLCRGCVWAVWAPLAPTWRGRPLSFEIKFNRKVLYCLTIQLCFFQQFVRAVRRSARFPSSFQIPMSLHSDVLFHDVHIVLVTIQFLKVESAGCPLYFCWTSLQNNGQGLYGSIWLDIMERPEKGDSERPSRKQRAGFKPGSLLRTQASSPLGDLGDSLPAVALHMP